MKTITLRGKTDSKGKLKVDIQTDMKNKDFEALLLLDSDSEEEPMDSLGWPLGYFEETCGSMADDPIERPTQLPLEQRESF
jgi:hypothetical protein